jgi:outer membrane protein OmpA-like peptidoglycan-associated protein
MSSHSQNPCGRVAVMRLAVVAVLCGAGTLAAAQDQPAPKLELFGGYSFLYPGADVHGTLPGGLLPLTSRLESNPRGAGASVTYNFNRWLGLTLDGSGNWGSGETTLGKRIDDSGFYNISAGPKVTFRSAHLSPFFEALVGDHRLTPDAFHDIDKLGFMVGGGLDVNLARHFALRLIRADYVISSYRYGPSSVTPSTDVRGVRLQSGLVFMFGGGGPAGPPASASCTINPSEVMVGESATATAAGRNFNSRHTLNYTWSSTGGKITGKDNTASIDTNGVAGGSYTVTAHISDPKMKKGGEASCMATFTVKEPPKNPPTISCSANPSTVQAGMPSTISCTCTSPDNAPVTVGGWTASGGSVSSSSGSTAALNTSGASAGPITVSATCTDSRGLTAAASTQVTVEIPPSPPPHSSKLSQCDFPNEKKPWRVDNTCKATLDDVAQNLQQNPDNKLVIVGNAEPTEKRKNLAAERAVNSKAYLATGEAKQGIDPSRMEARTGSAGTKTAEYWVVPAGASFAGEGTQAVDESKVKAVPDHPAPAKKAAKPMAQ